MTPGLVVDLITAVTVLLSIAVICGTVIVCLLATHVHHERSADARRQAEAAARDAPRALRDVR